MAESSFKTGLRRRKEPANVGAGPIVNSKMALGVLGNSSSRYFRNPQDRLCDAVVSWKILDEIVSDDKRKGAKGASLEYVLPNSYQHHDDYINAWEPMLLLDMKSSILSSLVLNTRKPSCTGVVHVSDVEGNTGHGGISSNINCMFEDKDSSDREQVNNMDLLLITLNPIHLPLNLSNIKNLGAEMGSYMLALVSRPDRGIQVKVSTNMWKELKVKLRAREDTLSKRKKNNPKQFDSQSISQIVAGNSNSSSIGSNSKKRSALPLQLSTFSKTNLNDESSREPKKNGSRNIKGESRYKLHYVIINRLTSSWREFLAIHELSSYTLRQEILSANRKIELASTPPTQSPVEKYSKLSESIVDQNISIESIGSIGSNLLLDEDNDDYNYETQMQKKERERGFRSRISEKLDEAEAKALPEASVIFKNKLRQNFNATQCLAIYAAVACKTDIPTTIKPKSKYSSMNNIKNEEMNHGFTLIQGPPGTGKTATVVGILNTIHMLEYDKYYKLLLSTVLSPEGLQCREAFAKRNDIKPWISLVSRLAKNKPHILVAAPSNIAVDNILQRIMEKGFSDNLGNKYSPDILRLGKMTVDRGMTVVREVSLEGIIEKEQLSAFEDKTRVSALKDAQSARNQIIAQIDATQTLLLNLSIAFREHSLPHGWELRIDSSTAMPYWVDHISKCTSTVAPKPVEDNLKLKNENGYDNIESCHFRKLDSLPEYQIYTMQITQMLEKLDRLTLFVNRCEARVNPYMHGGPSGVRQIVETSVIDQAHIVFATLSGCGHPCLESTDFMTTIIDEAGQCVEPSSLIALRRGCHRCIMVGDPKQLPATVFSEEARKQGYDRSLFERLISTGHPYTMLNTQYRMNPCISKFSSNEFYNNLLQDGNNVKMPDHGLSHIRRSFLISTDEDGVNQKAEETASSACLLPFMFLNVQYSDEKTEIQSLRNPEEAKLCATLLESILLEAKRLSHGIVGSVAIITPYAEQLQELKKIFQHRGLVKGASINAIISNMNKKTKSSERIEENYAEWDESGPILDIEINTVDGFQGREKDIVLISCVRSNDDGRIGFLSDKRRMNVALTRARFGMFVVGNALTLENNENWSELLQYAKKYSAFANIESLPQNNSHHMTFPMSLYSIPSEVKTGQKKRSLSSISSPSKLEEDYVPLSPIGPPPDLVDINNFLLPLYHYTRAAKYQSTKDEFIFQPKEYRQKKICSAAGF